MDPTNGWSFKDATMTTIILNGPICDQVMSGTVHDVTVASSAGDLIVRRHTP